MADSSFSIGGVTTEVDLDAAYANLMDASTAFSNLTVAVGYLMGVIMIFRGIAMYRAFGQHITQMSRNGELAGPGVYIIVGALLVYLPSVIDASLITAFNVDRTELSELTYSGTSTGTVDWSQVVDLINSYAKLIGLIAFVRGLHLISKAGDPGVQPGTISRGLVHFVAGVLLINIGATYSVLSVTFGFSIDGLS